jgi:FdhD protein
MALDPDDAAVRVYSVCQASGLVRDDPVAVEEPLELRAQGPDGVEHRVAVTMRTPGHDLELAAGFFLTEALLRSREDLGSLTPKALVVTNARGHALTLCLRTPFDPARLQRNFYATSSCGVCGKSALELVAQRTPALPPGPRLNPAVLRALPERLRAHQAVFSRTGGLHATGLFTADGALVACREDVGRHNAMDKVLGRALLDGLLPLGGYLLQVSGRASFELVQKAAMAGVPVLCAVSAPSSLAVETARRLGMTLIAFSRGEGFNVYAGPERLGLPPG